MQYRFRPQGVCSREMIFEISDDNKIESLVVEGGCNGNLKGIANLLKGMDIHEVVDRLDGVKCGFKNTSCPDQIAKALRKYAEN